MLGPEAMVLVAAMLSLLLALVVRRVAVVAPPLLWLLSWLLVLCSPAQQLSPEHLTFDRCSILNKTVRNFSSL